ncbi:NAD(+)/NADH kinase [Natrarchaeobaculum sulfurireducens]|uniref:NAD kinase n=1 Tax=Natrarchaeobaculum sulfurireducens TaxID=2044521 RepID=A0A346PI10_9EURY|nr:NAD(+)/NADH kinase [Natrarchaeobaculum sulfurireducens]AXR79155.1 NAD kinase [Natrarchaeobaculum sulfurireducens]
MEAAVGVVAQRKNDRAQALAETLLAVLDREYGERPVVDEETGDAIDATSVPVSAMAACELVVSIGGDGTLLFVAREVGDTPVLGVNLGEVGYLNAVDPSDALEVVCSLVGRLQASTLDGHELARLVATGADDEWTLEPALNEVVVHGPRRGHGGGATIAVLVDGRRYHESHADGVLVATPTGSTAYNLSEDGPLINPTTDALVISGMATAEPMAPLVVDPAVEIELSISDADAGYVIADGRNRRPLEPPATVSVSVADAPVRLVGPRPHFFEALGKLE